VALNTFAPSLIKHLISGITDRILAGLVYGNPLIQPAIEYVVFVLIAAALSLMAFYKKEMEF